MEEYITHPCAAPRDVLKCKGQKQIKMVTISPAQGLLTSPALFDAPPFGRKLQLTDANRGAPSGTPMNGAKEPKLTCPKSAMLPLGRVRSGDQLLESYEIAVQDLRNHMVVLAGAGSGKTVLLRRIVEEAALLGVPSVVIDGANDLSRLGEPWPHAPESWTSDDASKAARYHAETDVVVWTPGCESGNPLTLSPLPDLASLAADPEELDQAIGMAVDTLSGLAAKKDKTSVGVLASALKYYARQGGRTLSGLLGVLSDLPPDAGAGISRAPKVACALSDALRATIEVNPLLRQSGVPLEPGVLFGLDSDRVRVSVVSLAGLPSEEARTQFVAQLAMTFFGWIRKNPSPEGSPLRGLLVIDEAKDFVPSRATTPCKGSLVRLAAQARKYGLGLLFATQEPRSIDHAVISNARTHAYGRMNSPASIETVVDLIRGKGGSGNDVGSLPRGTFYVHSMAPRAPTKVAVPMCLSYHPPAPPTEADLRDRAARDRARVASTRPRT